MYLTYEKYVDMGGTLDENLFNQLNFEAQSTIDYYTYHRIDNISPEDYPEALTYCTFKLIALIANKSGVLNVGSSDNSTDKATDVSSMSNDGVSISYNILNASELITNSDKEIKNTISTYLYGLKDSLNHVLLYRGIYKDE